MTSGWSATRAGTAALAVLGCAIVVVCWQVVAAAQVFGTTIAPPTDVLAVYGDAGQRAVLIDAAQVTAGEAVTGFGWGFGIALVIGVAVVFVPVLRPGVDQLATIQNAIPFMALAPILLATVPREAVPAAMAACTTFFPIYIAVVAGLRAAPAALHDVCTVYGASRSQRLVRAMLPASVPVIANGLKVAMPLAIVGAVIGEWFGSSGGVGPVLLVAMRNYQMPVMWAAVVTTVTVALLLYGTTVLTERLALARFR